MTQKDIEFSIVSGSSESLLFGCIESVYSTLSGSRWSFGITVTVNAKPGLSRQLAEKFPEIRIIENATPRGFAANHNTAIAHSEARYVWLLNDDLVILPAAIDTITEYLDDPANSRVAVVSPRLLNPDGSLQPSTYSFPSMPQILLAHSGLRHSRVTQGVLRAVAPVLRSREGSSRFWAHDRTVEVDTFRGACVAMRMRAIEEVGPMVEIALVGAEETEWHRRFHEAGWKVVFHAGAEVLHYGSQTVGGEKSSLLPEYLKGALYFFRTSRSPASYKLFTATLTGMFAAKLAIQRLAGNEQGIAVTRRYLEVTHEAGA